MSTVNTEPTAVPGFDCPPCLGPVTSARKRRTLIGYLFFCALGCVPYLIGAPAAWQAAGFGLLFPGAGFISAGGWALLLFPLTLLLFGVSLIAWFGSGMIIAPTFLWLGTAALAGSLTGDEITAYGPASAVALVLISAFLIRRRNAKRSAADIALFAVRQQYLPGMIEKVRADAAPRLPQNERELSPADLGGIRYMLDRALQPVEGFNGFDKIDQFQTSAYRYQINLIGYGLALSQCNLTPNFHGYVSQAQRNLVDKYLQKKVWDYWIYETAWGHFNFTNFDPAGRDNVMLTGWLGLQANLYMSNTGDMRYASDGGLPFRLNRSTTYQHSVHTLAKSVHDNFQSSPFGLYACEPNWIYPICNFYGMTSLVIHDRLHGTDYVQPTLPSWLRKLDAEFTDQKGSVIGLRSDLTGMEVPFPTGEIAFATMTNSFAPDRAEQMWAIARAEVGSLLTDGLAKGSRLPLPGAGIDTGNYRRGHVGSYASIIQTAHEFGDEEFARVVQDTLDEYGALEERDGVSRFAKGSNQANALAAYARFWRRGDYHNAITNGPPATAFTGPLLTGASYPDVLVAAATSQGEDLRLVLYPGTSQLRQELKVERLKPGRRYQVKGGGEQQITAQPDGSASFTVNLSGRTEVLIQPEA